jgi:hypothetical protein
VADLNHICTTESGIERDDARIWRQWLHELTTPEWAAVVEALAALELTTPGAFLPQDSQVLQEATQVITRCLATGRSFVGTPMVKTSGHKTLAWRLTMLMREVVNRYNGVHIPNRPPPPHTQGCPPTPKFHDLFDQ